MKWEGGEGKSGISHGDVNGKDDCHIANLGDTPVGHGELVKVASSITSYGFMSNLSLV